MAITKIWVWKGRPDIGIKYILNRGKTEEQILTAPPAFELGQQTPKAA